MGGETRIPWVPRWLQAVVIGRRPLWTLARIAVIVVAALVIFKYVLTPPLRVSGISMLPTYRNGQINFLNRLAYYRHPPERGDVVGIRYSGEHKLLLKRIVALPGEKIAFKNGKLYIDDKEMEEPYVKTECDWNMPPRRLAAEEYYVVGDNRSMAFADHMQGVALREQIVGRVLWRGGS
jgi:signal peptidase I